MQNLVENNKYLKLLYIQIENDQKSYLDIFKKEELDLQEKSSEINQLKLILNSDELENEINSYNESLNAFNFKIEKFNTHYDKQVNIFKNIIINRILEILKQYSLDNDIELILDSKNYILSNNSINITELISNKLIEISIEPSFEKYK